MTVDLLFAAAEMTARILQNESNEECTPAELLNSLHCSMKTCTYRSHVAAARSQEHPPQYARVSKQCYGMIQVCFQKRYLLPTLLPLLAGAGEAMSLLDADAPKMAPSATGASKMLARGEPKMSPPPPTLDALSAVALNGASKILLVPKGTAPKILSPPP